MFKDALVHEKKETAWIKEIAELAVAESAKLRRKGRPVEPV